eukprot:scaffold28009_cov55-Phaeocystis_antarctica.AAC.3
MADGSTLTVISSSSADVVGAGNDGTRVTRVPTDDTRSSASSQSPPRRRSRQRRRQRQPRC